MAESTISIDYTRIRRSVARELGLSRDSADWSSEQSQDIADIVSDGLNRFYAAYSWSFLTDTLEVPLYAPYTTGTVAVTSGVVTGSGTTFPSWAADGDLITDVAREVATYTSGTSITLEDTSYTVAAGTTYSLAQSGSTLPDNFGAFIGQWLYYRPGDTYRQKVELTSIDRIRAARWVGQHYTDYPLYAAVIPKVDSTTATAGQRYELKFWPASRAASRLVGRYRVNPDALDGTNKYALGGMSHSRTILLACLAEAQLFNEHQNPAHEERYLSALEDSIKRDKEVGTPPTLGFERGAHPQSSNDYWDVGIAPPIGAPDASNL